MWAEDDVIGEAGKGYAARSVGSGSEAELRDGATKRIPATVRKIIGWRMMCLIYVLRHFGKGFSRASGRLLSLQTVNGPSIESFYLPTYRPQPQPLEVRSRG